MECVITPKRLKELYPMKLFRQNGLRSTIYTFDNNQKYKEYNRWYQSLNDTFNQELLNSFYEQLEESSNIFSFPTTIVRTKNKLYGIISPFESGERIEDLNPLTDVNELLIQIFKCEIEIERLSKRGWLLNDINESNILVEGVTTPTIKIIDTDDYVREKTMEYNKVLRKNRINFFMTIVYNLLPRILFSSCLKNPKIKDAFARASSGYISTSEFLAMVYEFYKKRESFTDFMTLRKIL